MNSEEHTPSGQNDGRKTLPKVPPLDRGTADPAAAQAEEHQLEKAASKHLRDEIARKIIAWGMWVLMVVVFLVIISAVFTLGFHLLTPKWLHWLCEEDLQEVRNAVLSGAVVGLGTTYLRKYVQES